MRTNRRFAMGKKRAVLLVAALCFAAGLVAGALAAAGADTPELTETSSSLEAYLHGFASNLEEKESAAGEGEMFRASVFKHIKLVAAIWLLAFTPAGGFAVFILMLFCGASYGFTTALLVKNFGASGLAAGAVLYMPQSLVMIPAYFFMTYRSVNYVLVNSRCKNDNRPAHGAGENLKGYASSLAAGCVFAVFAGFIDTFAVPLFVAAIR